MASTLSAEMFRQIVDALRSDAAQEKDKRTGPRVGLRAQVDVIPTGGKRAKPISMRCRNLSASGIGLLHNREVPTGLEFIVVLSARGLQQPVHLCCVVVHCNRMADDVYTIGSRIIRVLSADEASGLSAAA